MLNGVVDRLPLHGLLPLLAQCHRTLAHGAPLVVVSELAGAADTREPPARDLIDGRPLHASTWELLLERSGFAEVAPLDGAAVQDHRVALTADHALVSGIHHFVPVLHRGDAVGRHTLRLRDASRARGFVSEIYVDTVDPETAEDTAPVLSYAGAAERGDVVVYQFATASAMAPWLAGRYRDARRQLPQHHAARPDGAVGQPSRPRAAAGPGGPAPAGTPDHPGGGRLGLQRGAPRRGRLRVHGGDPAVGRPRPGPHLGAHPTRIRPAGRGARWLAVGRVSPNKALEGTIAALAVARAHRDPAATLLIIGKPATDSYVAALHRYVAELGLADAVTFAGHAGDDTVASAYAAADVLVVTSEHEGFCVPVVEAMRAGLPVVAFDRGAVPEVLGGSGVLVSDKDPYALAAAIADLLADAPRRAGLREAGRRQLAELDLDSAADRFVGLLAPLVEGSARSA